MSTVKDSLTVGGDVTGSEFKAARESLGLTQTQLAKLIGYGSQSRIAEVEAREAAPSCPSRLLRAYLDGYRPADWPI